jgi:hypothetical protein
MKKVIQAIYYQLASAVSLLSDHDLLIIINWTVIVLMIVISVYSLHLCFWYIQQVRQYKGKIKLLLQALERKEAENRELRLKNKKTIWFTK